MRIIDNSGIPLYYVRGCLSPNKKISQVKIKEIVQKKGTRYYFREMDGSYLEGVIPLRDIYIPLSKWRNCWKEVQEISQQFRSGE